MKMAAVTRRVWPASGAITVAAAKVLERRVLKEMAAAITGDYFPRTGARLRVANFVPPDCSGASCGRCGNSFGIYEGILAHYAFGMDPNGLAQHFEDLFRETHRL